MIPLHRSAYIFIDMIQNPPERSEEITALVSELAHSLIRQQPGYLSAAILESIDGNRVVKYSQWESAETCRAATEKVSTCAPDRKCKRLLAHLSTPRARAFHLAGRIPATAQPTLAVGTKAVTLLSLFQLYNAANQRELLKVCGETTRYLRRQDCGLQWADLLKSLDGSTVAQLSRWETAEAYEKAMELPSVVGWLQRQVELSYPDVHLFEVMDLVPRLARRKSA
jgi:heme-degrading monooxygenase HmoA